MSESTASAPGFKPKKSVALSGTAAGNTALCTVGRTGNDLHYRGYDILDVATTCEFEEIAYLLVHGKLPTAAELAFYKGKLKSLRGLPAALHLDVLRVCLHGDGDRVPRARLCRTLLACRSFSVGAIAQRTD